MAKLTILAAFLVITLSVVVVAVAASVSASASSNGATNGNSSNSRHIQRKQLGDCEKFLTRSCRPGVLMVTNIINDASCHQRLHLCCEELERIEVQWRCREISRLVEQQLGEVRGKEKQEMLQKAKNLPALCRMGIGRCDIRPPWF
ncbi:hypothetical protein REPUB_Repub04eG0225800 [Reevesia pubescens]